MSSSDPVVVAGALHLSGRLQVREAAPHLTGLLYHEDAGVRQAAVETVLQLKATTLASSLLDILLDPDSGVRIAAARVLQELRYRAAAPRFKPRVDAPRDRA